MKISNLIYLGLWNNCESRIYDRKCLYFSELSIYLIIVASTILFMFSLSYLIFDFF